MIEWSFWRKVLPIGLMGMRFNQPPQPTDLIGGVSKKSVVVWTQATSAIEKDHGKSGNRVAESPIDTEPAYATNFPLDRIEYLCILSPCLTLKQNTLSIFYFPVW